MSTLTQRNVGINQEIHAINDKSNSIHKSTSKSIPQEDGETNDDIDTTDCNDSSDSTDRLGTLGKKNEQGYRELHFAPRKNVPFLHECTGNLSIFILTLWWVVGCACYGIIALCLFKQWFISAAILTILAIYPKIFSVKPWPLFRWLMAKGLRPLDLYAKKGYALTFQNGAYEAIARTDPNLFLSKSSRVRMIDTEGSQILATIHKENKTHIDTSSEPTQETSNEIVKTTETVTDNSLQTDTEKNPVLLSYHPHGVFPVSYYLSGVCCEPLFRVNPNIRFLIASALYEAPIWKFLVDWLDKFDSAEKKSMTNLMENKKDIALLPGGFEEASIYRHGQHRIYIKNRTGFIKYALQYGYTIVPVYTFGEELNYYNLPGFYKFRLWLNKYHIPGVFFSGKLFGLGFSSHGMHTIFGEPIHCPKIENPTSSQIEEYHQLYIQKITSIFENNKHRCGQPEAKLEIW